jgi:hypothetical protein
MSGSVSGKCRQSTRSSVRSRSASEGPMRPASTLSSNGP